MQRSLNFIKTWLLAYTRFISKQIQLTLAFITFLTVFALGGWTLAFHYYLIATAVPLISNDVLAQQTLAQTSIQAQWQTVTVKSGDTLEKIFARKGLAKSQLMQLVSLGKLAQPLKHLHPGQQLELLITSDQQLQELSIALGKIGKQKNLTFTYTDNGFIIGNAAPNLAENAVNLPLAKQANQTNKNITTPLTNQLKINLANANANSSTTTPAFNNGINYGHAIIQTSLYDAALQAGLTHKQAMQLVTLASQANNLARNIRRGDQLSVLYQNQTSYVLAAEILHRHKAYQFFRFTDPKGSTDYYTQDGLNLHPPLMRAPLAYSHISSRFSAHRWEPILHFFRPHYGVDYAAPAGTPIKAAGDGKIIFYGDENGYGRVAKIKHAGPYETVYGHMSRFAKSLHDGSEVHQGEIIGYVGDSGLSTGNHLHFEIRINNTPHNPLTVALPTGSSIPGSYRPKFFAMTKQLMAQLDSQPQTQVVAHAG